VAVLFVATRRAKLCWWRCLPSSEDCYYRGLWWKGAVWSCQSFDTTRSALFWFTTNEHCCL